MAILTPQFACHNALSISRRSNTQQMEKPHTDTAFCFSGQRPHRYGITFRFALHIGTQTSMIDDIDASVMSNKYT